MNDWAMISAISAIATVLGSLLTWVFTRGGKAAMLDEQVKREQSRNETLQTAYNTLLERLHAHERR